MSILETEQILRIKVKMLKDFPIARVGEILVPSNMKDTINDIGEILEFLLDRELKRP